MGGNKISASGVSLKWVKAEDVERKKEKNTRKSVFVVKKLKSRSKAISVENKDEREKERKLVNTMVSTTEPKKYLKTMARFTSVCHHR